VRALLVFNPNATTTDDRVRDAIATTLGSALDLDVRPTKQRGHATHLVAGAVHEGVDVVFALGGDGTANEVLQALVGTGVPLGAIPGGGANILARALGLPRDPLAATEALLAHLREGRRRTITLGRVAGRYLSLHAGFGFDAQVVRRVEQHPRRKRLLRDGTFVLAVAEEWFAGAGRAPAELEVRLSDGRAHGPYAVTIVANCDPYTYLGPRPMHVHPRASFDAGLDVVAVRPVGTARLLAILSQVFRNGGHVDADDVDYWTDLDGFELSAAHPQPLMVDGDYAGEHRVARFEAVRQALTVLGAQPDER
jgi:diacylglycerol kinase family enzyme